MKALQEMLKSARAVRMRFKGDIFEYNVDEHDLAVLLHYVQGKPMLPCIELPLQILSDTVRLERLIERLHLQLKLLDLGFEV